MIREDVGYLRDIASDNLAADMMVKLCGDWDETPGIEKIFDRLAQSPKIIERVAIEKAKIELSESKKWKDRR